jgi:hypothetical protein
MRRRRLAILLAVPLIAVAVLAAGVVLLVPEDRIAALAAERAEAALGREVRLSGVSLDFFPRPAVALEGVALAGPAGGAGDRPVATVRRVLLRPRLLPLLRREVSVDAIVVEGLRLLVEVDENGVSNLPTLAADSGGGGGGDVAFAVKRFVLRDARVGYRDLRSGTVVRLDGLEQELRLEGEVQGGELARILLEGGLVVSDLDATLPGRLAVPVRDLRLRVVHRAILDRTADRLAIDRLELGVQELKLSGKGEVRGLAAAEGREVDLELAAASFDVGDLIASLPEGLWERFAPPSARARLPQADGRAAIQASVRGRLGGGALPAVDGRLTLDSVSLAYGRMGEVLTGVGGEIAFSLDSVATPALTGRILGEPFRLAFAVHDLAAPDLRLDLDTRLDLGRAQRLGLLPDSVTAGGRLALDVAARGPIQQPARMAVDGTIDLAGVAIQTPTLGQPARVEAGRVVLRENTLRGEGIQLRLGESDLAVDLTLRDWLPFVLGDSTVKPRATFDARSRRLDADALLGVDSIRYSELLFARLAGRRVNGKTVEELAEAAQLRGPKFPFELEGRLRAGELIRNGLELRNVDVDLAAGGTGFRLVELRGATFQLMGGDVRLTGRLGETRIRQDQGEEVVYPVAVQFEMSDAGAGPFFNTFTPFRNHLSGALSLAGTARVVLDKYLLPLRDSVAAEGTILATGGRLANWPALRALGQRLGVADFDTLTFRDWAGRFHVSGPRVALRESVLESDELRVRAAGVFDFAGQLDIGATLELSQSLVARARVAELSRLASVAAGEGGRVPVGLRLAGTAQDPQVQLDFSQAAGNLQARAQQRVEEEGRELAEKAAREAVERLLPADSLATPVDSVRKRLETELRGKLGRFFNR